MKRDLHKLDLRPSATTQAVTKATPLSPLHSSLHSSLRDHRRPLMCSHIQCRSIDSSLDSSNAMMTLSELLSSMISRSWTARLGSLSGSLSRSLSGPLLVYLSTAILVIFSAACEAPPKEIPLPPDQHISEMSDLSLSTDQRVVDDQSLEIDQEVYLDQGHTADQMVDQMVDQMLDQTVDQMVDLAPPPDREPPRWGQGGLTSTALSPNTVRLEWDSAEDDQEVQSYLIFSDGLIIHQLPATQTNLEIDDLLPHVEYHFAVQARDDSGNESTDGPEATYLYASVELQAPTWPERGSLVGVWTATDRARLRWPSALDDSVVQRYQIRYLDQELPLDALSTTFEVTGLTQDQAVEFELIAFDLADNPSAPLTLAWVQREEVPPTWLPESEVALVDARNTSLTWRWPAAQDNDTISGYRITLNSTEVATLDAQALEYQAADLSMDSAYEIEVRAFDPSGNTSPPLRATFNTLPDTTPPAWPPEAALELSATLTQVEARWPEALDASEIIRYEVSIYHELEDQLLETTRLNASERAYTFSDLPLGIALRVSVIAVDAQGIHSAPLTGIVSTLADTEGPSWDAEVELRLREPGRSAISVVWPPASDNVAVAFYRVYQDGIFQGIVEQDPSVEEYVFLAQGLNAGTEYTFRVEAYDLYLNRSADDLYASFSTLLELPVAEDVAPPLNQRVFSGVGSSTRFLFSGEDPLQTNVEPETIEEEFQTVIRGQVYSLTGAPIAGVGVTINGRDDYGETVTDVQGRFFFALNGGGLSTIQYFHPDYAPIQRQLDVKWRAYQTLPTVYLMNERVEEGLEPLNLPIALGEEVDYYQSYQSAVARDIDGDRRITVVVPPSTEAEIYLSDGASQSLSQMTLHISEFTEGLTGPESMPGALPSTTAYNNASNIVVEEAELAGAIQIDGGQVFFNQPVYYYTDNFLGLPIGTSVPVGIYDQATQAWNPQPNANVIGLIERPDGVGLGVDLIGSGTPATPEQMALFGITQAELDHLAALGYTSGATLWRAPLPHFSLPDCNPFTRDDRDLIEETFYDDEKCEFFGPESMYCLDGPPVEATIDEVEELQAFSELEPPSECQKGSRIDVNHQTLTEHISIVGTPFFLAYSSKNSRGARVPVALSAQPDVDRVILELRVAGQTYQEEIAGETLALGTHKHYFTWDRRDVFGRLVPGVVPATLEVCYFKRRVSIFSNETIARFDNPTLLISWLDGGNFGDTVQTENGYVITSRVPTRTCQTQALEIGGYIKEDLGGWRLSSHHMYNPDRQMVFYGTGHNTKVTPTSHSNQARELEFAEQDGVEAFDLESPQGVAVAEDGTLYVSDAARHQVFRVDPNGVMTHFAGRAGGASPEDPASLGDGGDAREAVLSSPRGLALGAHGELYIADQGHDRVRVVTPDGHITTVAGVGCRFCEPGEIPDIGDGGLAVEAYLNGPTDVAVDRDGALYIADTNHGRIRKVRPGERFAERQISTVAGETPCPETLAECELSQPEAIELLATGELLIADTGHHRVLQLNPDGLLAVFAGGGDTELTYLDFANPLSPLELYLESPSGLAVFRDQVFISSRESGVVYSVTRAGELSIAVGSNRPFENQAGLQKSKADKILLREPAHLDVDPEGRLLITEPPLRRVVSIFSPFSTFIRDDDVFIPSQDGEFKYRFSREGVLLETYRELDKVKVYEFEYDDVGRLITIRDVYGSETRLTYQADQVTIQSPRRGDTTLNLTDSLLTSVTTPVGDLYTMEYNDFGQLKSFQPPRFAGTDRKTEFFYEHDRLIREVGPYGKTFQISREEDEGEVTIQSFEASESRVKTVVQRFHPGRGGFESSVFHGPDDLLYKQSQLTPDGKRIETYRSGVEIEFEFADDPRFDGQVKFVNRHTLNLYGDVHQREERREITDYHDNGSYSWRRETTKVGSAGQRRTRTTSYNGEARTMTIELMSGQTVSKTFDERGNTVQALASSIPDMYYEYSPTGQVTSMRSVGTDGSERITTLEYNEQDQLIRFTDPLNRVTEYEYDERGYRIATHDGDQLWRTTRYTYDESGHLLEVTTPQDETHQQAYINGQRVRYSPPLAAAASTDEELRWHYGVDQFLTSLSYSEDHVLSHNYDEGFQRVRSTEIDALDHREIYYEYSSYSGLIRNIYGPSDIDLRFWHYGGLISREYVFHDSFYVYLHRDFDEFLATEEITVYNSASDSELSIPYRSDPETGLMQQRGEETFSFDALTGSLLEAQLGQLTIDFAYDPFFALSQWTLSNSAEEVASLHYQRDALNRVTHRSLHMGAEQTHLHYIYDDVGQLSEVRALDSETGALSEVLERFTYDAHGNLTLIERGDDRIALTYDADDHLLTRGAETFSYDSMGSLATHETPTGTSHYSYDLLGNLREATLEDGTLIEYKADGLHRRSARYVNGELERAWIYEDQTNPLLELDSTGAIAAVFIYGVHPHVPDYVVRDGRTYRLILDQVGSVLGAVDADTGEVAQTITYSAWGEVLSDSNPDLHPFRFAGGLYDSATGLIRFGARDYDPRVGRWTARDTALFQSMQTNLYVYVNNDPINLFDPSGQIVFTTAVILTIAATALLGAGTDAATQTLVAAEQKRQRCGYWDWGAINEEGINTTSLLISGAFGALTPVTGGLSQAANAGRIAKSAPVLMEIAEEGTKAIVEHATNGGEDPWGTVGEFGTNSTNNIFIQQGGQAVRFTGSKKHEIFYEAVVAPFSKTMFEAGHKVKE